MAKNKPIFREDRFGVWYIEYHSPETGRRTRKSLGKDKLAAQAMFNKMCHELAQGEPIVADDVGLMFFELRDMYLKDLASRDKPEDTIKNVLLISNKHFLPFFGEDRLIRDITYAGPKGIVEFVAGMRQKRQSRKGNIPYSNGSINRVCQILRTILKYAVDNDLLAKNPMKKWRPAREKPREFKLTLEDFRKILDCAPVPIQRAMLLTYYTGMRPGRSELFAITWDKVHWDEKRLEVYGRKTNKTRFIPLSDEFLHTLRCWKEEAQTEYILERNGKPLANIDKIVRDTVVKAGIPYRVRMYDLRHMFATFMINKGADIAAVSKLLGHANISMTVNNYYQALEVERERAISLLPTIPDQATTPKVA